MDIKQDFKDFARKIKMALLDHGSMAAMHYLNTTSIVCDVVNEDVEILRSEAYIQGMIASLDAQKQIDLDRIIEAFNNLQRLGVSPGVGAAMKMGLPLRELIVTYSPSLGRIGDYLSQIRRLIAVKYVRDLIKKGCLNRPTFPRHISAKSGLIKASQNLPSVPKLNLASDFSQKQRFC